MRPKRHQAWLLIAQGLLCLTTAAADLAAHGGGLDRYGGHTNRRTGVYHCHREPCYSRARQRQTTTPSTEPTQNNTSRTVIQSTPTIRSTPTLQQRLEAARAEAARQRLEYEAMVARAEAARREAEESAAAAVAQVEAARRETEESAAVAFTAFSVIGAIIAIGALWKYRKFQNQAPVAAADAPIKPLNLAAGTEPPNPMPGPPRHRQGTPRTNRGDPEGTILSGKKTPAGAGIQRMTPKPVASDANVEFTKKLGSGGFGITWQARDYVTRQEVAIKIYRPADWADEGPDGRVSLRSEEHREEYEWGLKRFLEEGQLLRTVSHQAVVRVHRHGHGYGSAYLVMELIAGQSLREHMKRTQPARDIQAVRRLMLDLCAGLDAIHRAGIVHRDVKPGNVMLRTSGQPVLIDFGSARQRSQDRTRSMTAVVTPGYAPLEQYDRNGRQGPWTDLYALAAMGHEMLLGRRPGDAAGRVANPKLEPLDDLERRTGPSRTINAIRRGLAVQASERPQTCEEMVRLLTEKPGRCEPQEGLSLGATPMGRTSIGTSKAEHERGSEAPAIAEPKRDEKELWGDAEMENDWLGLRVIWSGNGLEHEYLTSDIIEEACEGNENFIYPNHPLMGELVAIACRDGIDWEEIGISDRDNLEPERKHAKGLRAERDGHLPRTGNIRSYSIIAPLQEDFARRFYTDPPPEAVLLQGTGAPCDTRHSCAILTSQKERSNLQGSATHHNVSPMLLEGVVWKSSEAERISEEDPRTRRLVAEICERGTDLERARDRNGWKVERGRKTDHNGRRRGYSIVADLKSGACTSPDYS